MTDGTTLFLLEAIMTDRMKYQKKMSCQIIRTHPILYEIMHMAERS